MCQIVEGGTHVPYLLHCNRLESCQTFLAFHGMNFDVVEVEIGRINRRRREAKVEADKAAASVAAAAAAAKQLLSITEEAEEAVATKKCKS